MEVDDTVVFGPGSVLGDTMCIAIEIINDDMTEITELFVVSASTTSPNVAFNLGGNQATVSIIDDDGIKARLFLSNLHSLLCISIIL